MSRIHRLSSTLTAFLALALSGAAVAAPVVTINEGAEWTSSMGVTVAIDGADGYSQMCLSNTAKCESYVDVAASTAWTLKKGSGKRTVTVFLKGDAGTTTAADSPRDDIVLDERAPSGGKLTADYGDEKNTLTWTAFADAHSGVAAYRLFGAAGVAAPACVGTPLYEGPDLTFDHTGLENGTLYSYRLCAVDNVGNISTGLKKSEMAAAQPRPESLAPTGTVTINSDAARTASSSVTLTIAATDASSVSAMCVTEKTTCKTWESYATSKPFTLSKAAGTRTVRVWFKDQWNNTPTTAQASDTIVLDNKPPTGGTVTVAACDGGAALTWTGFTDAHSSVALYKVYVVQGKKPPTACTGTASYSGEATNRSITGLTNGVLYSYAVCATDVMGNLTKKAKTGKVTPASGTTCPANPVDGGDGEGGWTGGGGNGGTGNVHESTHWSCDGCANSAVLLASLDGTSTTYQYSWAGWTDSSTFGGATDDPYTTDIKKDAFSTLPLKMLVLEMITGETRKAVTFMMEGETLASVFSGSYRATSLGRAAWRELVPDNSMQANCNREGFNIFGTAAHFTGVRLGLVANQENECASPDSFIGIGTRYNSWAPQSGYYTTIGNVSHCLDGACDNGKKNIPSRAVLWGLPAAGQ